MMRSIAKFLIEYYHDARPSTSEDTNHTVRLPRWLRAWTNSDSQLRIFEKELLGLERNLVSQANKHLSNPFPPANLVVPFSNPSLKPTGVLWRPPIPLAALAAGLTCLLMTSRWLVLRPTVEPQDKPGQISMLPSQPKQKAGPSDRDEWLRSALVATKRLAADFEQKQGKTADSLAVVNRTLFDQGKQFKILGLNGLRFVAQKLPAASVRLLGMSGSSR